MDNKDIFDLLDNAEDSVLDELDGLCEPLDKAADKRILALAQRKSIRSNIGTNDDYSDKVEGVERVMKRPWKSTFATVAAAVLICGGTVGGFAVLRTRNKPADTVPESETSVSRTTENRMDITEEAFVTTVSPEDNAVVTGKAQPLTTADTAENGTDTPAVTTADGGTDEPAIITAAVVTTAGKTTTEAAATDKVTTTAKTTTQKPKTTGTVTDITTKTGETEIHRLESGAYLVDIKAGQVYEWFDRSSMFSEKLEVIKLSAFDDRYFTYEDGCICMNNTSAHTKEKLLDEWATLTHGAHFADLNSDGYPELCLSVTGGSGVCVDYAAAYDIHNDKMYKLVDWMKMDYMFGCKDGAICLLRCEYPQNWAEGDTLVPVIDSEHGLICREQNGVSAYEQERKAEYDALIGKAVSSKPYSDVIKNTVSDDILINHLDSIMNPWQSHVETPMSMNSRYKIELIRKIDDNRMYTIHKPESGGLFYSFYVYGGLDCTAYITKAQFYTNYSRIKAGSSINEVIAIEPATQAYVDRNKRFAEIKNEEPPIRFTQHIILTDGLLKLTYIRSGDTYKVERMDYFDDYMETVVYDEEFTCVYDYSILPQDYPE